MMYRLLLKDKIMKWKSFQWMERKAGGQKERTVIMVK